MIISECQGRTAHADLSNLAVLRQLILFVEQQDFSVMEWSADRHYLIECEIPVDLVIAAHSGRLSRSVKVGKLRVRKCLLPDIKLLDREYLAAESNRV